MQHEVQRDINFRRMLDERKVRAEKLQLHRAVVGSVKRPIMWRDLRRQIRDRLRLDTGLLFQSFVNMEVSPDQNSFTLERVEYPQGYVHAIFQAGMLIELHYRHKRTDNAIPAEWEDRIDMPVDELDRVSFEHRGKIVSDEYVAMLILDPVRNPAFNPPHE